MNIQNRKASYEYEFLETYTAGMQLLGSEVKSIRDGKCSLQNNYCTFINGELFAKEFHISEYKNSNAFSSHGELRLKKLLLNKKELNKLERGLETKGTTIIITKIIEADNGKLKALIALARGKNNYNKKTTIQDRDIKRETERLLKNKDN